MWGACTRGGIVVLATMVVACSSSSTTTSTTGEASAEPRRSFPVRAPRAWSAPPAVVKCFTPKALDAIDTSAAISEIEAFNVWRDGFSREEWARFSPERQQELLAKQREYCDFAAELAAEASVPGSSEALRCCIEAASHGPD
jgi:hypothetical protein